MDHGAVIHVKLKAEFDSALLEASKSNKVVVIDFTATWCGPCKIMSPIFVELSKKHPELVFLKVDVDELKEIALQWDVQAMPTFIFVQDGKLVHRIVGANKHELEKKAAFFAHHHS